MYKGRQIIFQLRCPGNCSD